MKFTLSWLKDHLDTTADVALITDSLTDLGLEVEALSNPADMLKNFTLGYIKEAEKHPDADRLRVCKVDTDEGEVQIICGAPNARAGITVVVAKPGVYVPGIDTTISVGKIRGVESYGMMASERELELSQEHDGIIELPSGVVGQPFSQWLMENNPAKVDPMIEIAITPNRPDALGVRGIARDLAARGLGTLKPLQTPSVNGSFESEITAQIAPDTCDVCPVFCLRLIKGVKNGPSPMWLQDRLRAIGLRPISFLVDVTNFFSYDLNRPLHVFDADKVSGQLHVHRTKGGEELCALDEKTYTLNAGQIAISDESGVLGIAGIMGGLSTGCTEDTVNVLVESAYWDPVQTAYTGRALKLNSDARYRFERGIDPEFTAQGLDHAVAMILETAGGVSSHMFTAGMLPQVKRSYKLDTKRCISLVGMDIPANQQRETLTHLGFMLEGDIAHVPSWRPDVQDEADLIEEIARVASLSKLQGKPLARLQGVTKPVLSTQQRRLRLARRTAAALGYHECVTYSFIEKGAAVAFGGGQDETMLENPISSEMTHMRPQLLAGLLQAAARNQARGVGNMALFEAGHVFDGGEPDENHLQISGLLIGQTGAKDIHGESRTVDVYDAKADIEAMLNAIGAPKKVQILRGAEAWWHPGRHGKVCLGPKKVLGVFGELHPKILQYFDVSGPAVAFTVYPQNIPTPKKNSATRPALNAADLQSVERDLAFIVERSTEALTLINAALGADKTMISNVCIFDEFQGGTLADSQKSLALRVTLQPKDATLKDAEIDAIMQKIITKVTKATGGELRG